ncbi:hypothetical protein B0H34DRAFT_680480 [Crassisporium funariophilum]|nr:hypothetical protein B0H34DRAFT_680480 [Crassisporium funariophilum]
MILGSGRKCWASTKNEERWEEVRKARFIVIVIRFVCSGSAFLLWLSVSISKLSYHINSIFHNRRYAAGTGSVVHAYTAVHRDHPCFGPEQRIVTGEALSLNSPSRRCSGLDDNVTYMTIVTGKAFPDSHSACFLPLHVAFLAVCSGSCVRLNDNRGMCSATLWQLRKSVPLRRCRLNPSTTAIPVLMNIFIY